MGRNLVRTHGFEPLALEGRLPEGLAGTLFRAGPARYERGGKVVSHPFEADGALVGVKFAGGEAQGAIRYVESEGYQREEAAGRFLTGSHVLLFRRVSDMVRGRMKNTGNTSVLLWQERMFALMEAGKPVEMSTGDLHTVGDTDLGVIPAAFSAHPHRHPTRSCQINFGVRFGPTTWLDLFELPDVGRPRVLGSIKAPWAAMIHDFALTERHMVFVVGPAVMQLGKAILGLVGMTDIFAWKPAMGARVVVVPLDDPDSAWSVETDACWVWHVVNGWEDGDQIVVDVAQYPDADSLQAIGEDAAEVAPPLYIRWRIDTRTREAVSEQMWDVPMEFPSVRRMGVRHGEALVQSLPERSDAGNGRHGISLVDVDAGTDRTFVFDEGQAICEPLLLPHEGGEAVVTVVRGGGDDHLAVLDAARLEDGPMARLRFDQPLPMTFHGRFQAG